MSNIESPNPNNSIGLTESPDLAIRAERAVLIKAIRSNPENNQLRLDYADLLDRAPLDESDPARAKLIRLQIARGGEPASQEETQILDKYREGWEKSLGAAAACLWDRGFIVGMYTAPLQFVQHTETIRLEPISSIRFYTFGLQDMPMHEAYALIGNELFKTSIARIEMEYGEFEMVVPFLKLVPDDAVLKEIHFFNFTDDRSVFEPSTNPWENEMQSKNRLRDYAGKDGRSDSYIFGNTVISFSSFEEGAACYFGTLKQSLTQNT